MNKGVHGGLNLNFKLEDVCCTHDNFISFWQKSREREGTSIDLDYRVIS